MESPSSYPAPAVPVVSSAVSSVLVPSGQERTVRSSGTIDTFPTYVQSPGEPGYLLVTSPVSPQFPEDSLPLLGSESFTPGAPGSLDSLLAYDISLLDSAADLTQLAVPLPGDLQLLADAALERHPVLARHTSAGTKFICGSSDAGLVPGGAV